MKRYLFYVMTLLSLLGFGCNDKPTFKSVGVEEFAAVIEDSNTIVVDVRRADEWAAGHLEAATYNIDVLKEDFEQIAEATLPKDKTIAIYCRSGRRSKDAATKLAQGGFEVVELDGGVISWQDSGRELVK